MSTGATLGHAWETFYLVVGTAAAALVGVMFIVATLTAEIALEQINRGTIIYQTPIVFHLGVIVAVSALALVPELLLLIVAALIAVLGVTGLAYSGLTIRRMSERYDFYKATGWDHLFFGVLPGLTYFLILAGGGAVFAAPEMAAEAVGAGTLLLLLVSIRNAWDVATFSIRIAGTVAAKDSNKEKNDTLGLPISSATDFVASPLKTAIGRSVSARRAPPTFSSIRNGLRVLEWARQPAPRPRPACEARLRRFGPVWPRGSPPGFRWLRSAVFAS